MPTPRHRSSLGPLALALVALALLSGAAWFMLSADDASTVAPTINIVGAAAPSPDEEQEVEVPDLVLPAASPEVESRVDLVAAETSLGDEAASALVDVGRRMSEPVLILSGRFVEYVNGSPVDSTIEGTTNFMVQRGETGFHMGVLDVKGGEFRLELRQGSEARGSISGLVGAVGDLTPLRLMVEALTSDSGATLIPLDLDDVSTVMSQPAEVPFGTTDLILPVRRAPAIELSVLEAGTGRHLEEVEVLGSPGQGRYLTFSWDAEPTTLIEGEASPVTLEGKGRMATSVAAILTVSAKGYGKNEITVDFTQPGARTVELTRAGSLHVTLNGSMPRGAMLHVRGMAGQRHEESRPRAGEVSFDALAAGEYRATLALGDSFSARVVLASGSVWVRAGVQNELSLDVEPREPVAYADVEGRLYLPEEWAIPSPRLKVALISSSKTGAKGEYWLRGSLLVPVEGQPGWFDFELSTLEVGTYSIVLNDLSFAETFELPPEGVSDLVLEIPAPLDIIVAIEDAETGEDLPDIKAISWSPVRPEGLHTGGSSGATRDQKTNDFPLRVPACDITVRVHSKNYRANETITPQAGERFAVKVKPKLSTYLELRSGENSIPWPNNEFPYVKNRDGTRAPLSLGINAGKRLLTSKEPGTFFLEVPKISGFQPHPPVEFTLEVGSPKTLVIELTRE